MQMGNSATSQNHFFPKKGPSSLAQSKLWVSWHEAIELNRNEEMGNIQDMPDLSVG
jgi:hypothetical protein